MADDQVTIRMYDVGFGDCFLLRFPTPDGGRKVLVDCGRHPSGPKRDMGRIVGELITAVADGEPDGQPRIDVVVATHRHRDHVSGFEDERWGKVEVKEVWLPWTEDPHDEQARRILLQQSRVARAMQAAFGPLSGAPFNALLANTLKNDAAMKILHRGFKNGVRPKFLSCDEDPAPLETEVMPPSVRVHVLGPSRDPDVIRDLDPPEGKHYLAALGAAGADEIRSGSWRRTFPSPFGDRWRLDPGDVEAAYGAGRLATQEEKALAKLNAFDAMAFAVAMDKAVNGTSLMLLFQVDKTGLLFPGDAEWGTWKAAMDNAARRRLLERTTFYKVSHHGSYNGTPRRFVEELLSADAWSMVSTGHVGIWPLIPKTELMEALGGPRVLLRSDQEPAAGLPSVIRTDLFTEVSLPV